MTHLVNEHKLPASWQLTAEEINITMRQVTEYTGISEEQQIMDRWEAGYRWLEQFTHSDPTAMQYLPRTDQFWGFWKLTWHRMDKDFIRHIHRLTIMGRLEREDVELILLEYEAIHRIEESNTHLYCDEVEHGYHNIIKTLSLKR